MVERARVFKGSTELSFSGLRWSKNSSVVVNEGRLNFLPTSGVAVGNVLSVKKNDGSTNVFSAKIVDLRDVQEWEARIYNNGFELINRFVEKVYTNASPESIVQDVVNNFTNNLTYASSYTSGFTIPKYIARGYGQDIIKEMMRLLRWRFRIDENDNAYFEPVGSVDNGVILTHGDNFQVVDWGVDATQMANKVRAEGGFKSYFKEETLSGSGTTFALSKKPKGTFYAETSGGTEIANTAYTVNSEDKEIEFTSSQSSPRVKYEYQVPIIVVTEDSDSITDYEESYKEVRLPGVNTQNDIRKFAQEVVTERGQPYASCKGVIPFLDFDAEVNQRVTVVDESRGISKQFIIEKIEYDCESNTTTLVMGTQTFDFAGWQAEVQENINQLIRSQRNDDEVTFARQFSHELDITFKNFNRFSVCYPRNNHFTLDHVTLGRLPTSINHEADCSDNFREGEWQGSDIDGEQYVYNRHILGGALFNGTDNYVTLGSQLTLTGNRGFAFALKPRSLAVQPLASQLGNDAGDFELSIVDTSGHLRFRRWTGTSDGYEDWTTTTMVVSISEIQTIAVSYNGTNATFYKATSSGVTSESPTKTTGNSTQSAANLFVGRSGSSYYSGFGDEFKIFDTTLTSGNVEDLHDATFDGVHALYGNCDLWWSFDDPRLGDLSDCAGWCHSSGPTGYEFKEYLVDQDFIKTDYTTATIDTTEHSATFN